jgi:hypothetical protein
MRELLKDNQQLLASYNDGRSKKKLGNILIISGLGLLFTGVLTEFQHLNLGINGCLC